MKQITLLDKTTLSFDFEKSNYIINHQNSSDLFSTLVAHMRSILLPEEFPKIEFDLKQVGEIKEPAQPFIRRVEYLYLKGAIKQPINLLNKMSKNLQRTSTFANSQKPAPIWRSSLRHFKFSLQLPASRFQN
jgi:hypothetical protein